VKNLFGAFVGLTKSRWHLQAGRDSRCFARLLLEVEHRIRPALTLLDGVVAMEGNGPTAGMPRSLGFIAGATSALALDGVIADLLDIRPPRSRFWLKRRCRADPGRRAGHSTGRGSGSATGLPIGGGLRTSPVTRP